MRRVFSCTHVSLSQVICVLRQQARGALANKTDFVNKMGAALAIEKAGTWSYGIHNMFLKSLEVWSSWVKNSRGKSPQTIAPTPSFVNQHISKSIVLIGWPCITDVSLVQSRHPLKEEEEEEKPHHEKSTLAWSLVPEMESSWGLFFAKSILHYSRMVINNQIVMLWGVSPQFH